MLRSPGGRQNLTQRRKGSDRRGNSRKKAQKAQKRKTKENHWRYRSFVAGHPLDAGLLTCQAAFPPRSRERRFHNLSMLLILRLLRLFAAIPSSVLTFAPLGLCRDISVSCP
jgi:hypothetical protein